jgi:hypothetical protein
MPSFGELYARTFVRPKRAFEELVAHPRALAYAGAATGITALTYTLVYFFLAHNGGRPTTFTPWLAIPADDYYRYNLFLHAPSILLAWISAAGFAQLTARALGGRGTFEHTLAVLGFGLSISTWWTGVHDLVTTFLGFVGVLDQRAYEDAMNAPTPARTLLWILMTGYLVSFLVLFTKGLRVAHGLTLVRAASTGTVAFAVYQTVFVIFNR